MIATLNSMVGFSKIDTSVTSIICNPTPVDERSVFSYSLSVIVSRTN